ncbi:2539_t:CDS:2 [Gigaspora margarita]|uniref:2539_t:CDS:1 n=1 Tax=Gigaspora margarita TaxID=4874 RepID=A0ABN7USJ5_GIGMA|nr:2539_t:CDS:2 [Gigaspora margarita]
MSHLLKIKKLIHKSLNPKISVECEPDSDEFILSSKFWKDSKTKALLSFLAKNFEIYCKNKIKFYAATVIEIGNNRTSTQVNDKIQSLQECETRLFSI